MNSPDKPDERRVHPRTRTAIPATLSQGGEKVEGLIENIGLGGVFFATDELEVIIDEGVEVTLVFTCERNGQQESNELAGTVLRAERYFDGSRVIRAFAVKFDGFFDLDGLSLGT